MSKSKRVLVVAMLLANVSVFMCLNKVIAILEILSLLGASHIVARMCIREKSDCKLFALVTVVNFVGICILLLKFSIFAGICMIIVTSIHYTVMRYKILGKVDKVAEITEHDIHKVFLSVIAMVGLSIYLIANLFSIESRVVNGALDRSSSVVADSIGVSDAFAGNITGIMKVLPLPMKCKFIKLVQIIETGDVVENIDRLDVANFTAYVDYILTDNEVLNEFYEEQSLIYEIFDYFNTYITEEMGTEQTKVFTEITAKFTEQANKDMSAINDNKYSFVILAVLLTFSLCGRVILDIVLKYVSIVMYKRGLEDARNLDETNRG